MAWGRRAGLVPAALALVWLLICVGLSLPAYPGGALSPFLTRYVLLDLSAAPSATELAALLLTIRSYGFLPLVAPGAMPVALPALALNLLSTSQWMVGGHAHYPAVAGALLLVASIEGARTLQQRRLLARLPRRWGTAFSAAILPGWVMGWAVWAQGYGGRTPLGES